MASSPKVDAVVPNFCQLGEGPHWSSEEQCLYFIDIFGKKVCRYDPATKENKFIQLEGDENVSLIVPIEGSPNEFVIARARSLWKLLWDASKGEEHSLELLLSVEADKPNNRFNDGKCDNRGRLWAGTMGKDIAPGQVEPNMGSVFKVESISDNSANEIFSGVSISNGLCWSEDNAIMYYIDTMTLSVEALDFDDVTGTVSNRRILFGFEKNGIQGYPDGMTIDNRGHLWVACFGSGQVIEIDPGNNGEDAGQLVSKIELPATSITSVAFGGADFTDLYVTSATWGDVSGSSGAGSLFRITGAAQGLPAKSFKS